MENITKSYIETSPFKTFSSSFLSKKKLKDKYKASSIHLLLSFLLISSFSLFAIYYWFPNDILHLTGIKNVLFIIIIADLILGPALTFLVFDLSKKSLKFDLSAVIVLQLAMFCYGAYTVYQAHPVYITYTIDRFSLVPARDANPEMARLNEYKTSKLSQAILAYVESPKDIEERNKIIFESTSGGLDLDAHAEHYLPYNENIKNIIKREWAADDIFITPKQKQMLASFLEEKDLKLKNIAFLPIQGQANFMTYVVERRTALPIGSFKIDPWKSEELKTKK